MFIFKKKNFELYTMYPLYQKVNIQLYYISVWSVVSTYPHIIASSMSDSEKQHVNCLFEMQS